MAKILQVSTNEAVIATRRAILERAGHEVTVARNLPDVIAACTRTDFDIVIIGQTLSAREKQRVRHTVLGHCTTSKILEYHNGLAPDVRDADAHLHVASSSPDRLLEEIENLTRSNMNR